MMVMKPVTQTMTRMMAAVWMIVLMTLLLQRHSCWQR